MADEEADPAGIEAENGCRLDDESLYWFGEFCRFGMCSPQAAVLASRSGLDRHAVRESLLAARRRGTLEHDADYIFDAFS